MQGASASAAIITVLACQEIYEKGFWIICHRKVILFWLYICKMIRMILYEIWLFGSVTWQTAILAPIPLTVFRSNSKFGQILEHSGLKFAQPITMKFCTHHDSYTVVTCAKFHCDRPIYFEQEHYKVSLNFEFDGNIVSGMGTCYSAM